MTPTTPARSSEARPGQLKSTKSFPHHGAHDSTGSTGRTERAHTIQNGVGPEITVQRTSPKNQRSKSGAEAPDAFETSETEEVPELPRTSVELDDIPIELVSMTDNFIDSLTAKVHPNPPNVENLSRLFQDFYHTASQHIQTHLAALSTRQIRARSPRPSITSRSSTASLFRTKAVSITSRDKAKENAIPDSEQQMLTPEELASRKRARKALEQKRVLMEEAVERRLCEGIYDKIYRHNSTQDEAEDEKLRSKTAALDLVGIDLKDLEVNLGTSPEDGPEAVKQRQEEVYQHLEETRREITSMTEKRYPLGKLNHLRAAYKGIVETLSHFHPSSSADEIVPMLIYTLITMPPEQLCVISDLNFIQRFRWEEKIDGEAGYCLITLEAAINFLQTVDLSSLREDETRTGPAKAENTSATLKPQTFPPAYTPGLSPAAPATVVLTPGDQSKPLPSPAKTTVQRRRLSDLIQTPAQAIGNARDSFFDTADQSLKNIGNSLENSYNFLLGKIRDSSASGKGLVVPKTLDDARKLIGTPPLEDDASADGSTSVRSTDESAEDRLRLLGLIGGRGVRDRSADSASTRSVSSSKKALFPAFEDTKEKEKPTSATAIPASSSNQNLADQVRNLGMSLNPMNRLAGGFMRGFTRSATATPTHPQPHTQLPKEPAAAAASASKSVEGGDLSTAFPDIAEALPPKAVPQIKPPIKRFMKLDNPGDLRIGEVLDLLRDYRRLANALKDMGAFKE